MMEIIRYAEVKYTNTILYYAQLRNLRFLLKYKHKIEKNIKFIRKYFKSIRNSLIWKKYFMTKARFTWLVSQMIFNFSRWTLSSIHETELFQVGEGYSLPTKECLTLSFPKSSFTPISIMLDKYIVAMLLISCHLP